MGRISSLANGDTKVDISGFIVEKSDTRHVTSQNTGQDFDVCDFLLCETKKPDAANSIKMPLWNEQIEAFKVGDKVVISNGYVTDFQEILQLNVGRYGKIVKL
jgi:hypothetical protein